MPVPVPSWTVSTPITAKSMDLAAYTSDGSLDHPTGIAFLAHRPVMVEAYTRAGTFPSTSGGTQSAMTTSGTVTSCNVVLDAAGYYGKTSDLPAKGYYAYTAAIPGSAGDGINAGGWMLMHHVVPVKPGGTQTSVGADLFTVAGATLTGTRQLPSAANDSAPFFCDLVNVGQVAHQPAVFLADSSATSAGNQVNATDASGETPRFYAVWTGVSATSSGQASFTAGGVYNWTAPAGVTSVTVAAIGSGAGGGAGNVSGGGVEFGGGGGGGGGYAGGTVSVTAANSYPVTVGSGGVGGTAAGGAGGAGALSGFSGDTASVTAPGGAAGGGATTSANGAGGAGGSPSLGGVVFSTPGAGTWTCPAGITSIKVECWAGGGGGGGSDATTLTDGGGGGGGGEYAAELTVTTIPSTVYNFTVGAGGSGGVNNISFPGAGSGGGTTTITIGAVTVTANGGTGGQPVSATNAAGGTGSTNSVHFSGGQGGKGGSLTLAGGGGGSGGTASAGNPGGDQNDTGAPAVTGGGSGGGSNFPGGAPGGGGGGGLSNGHAFAGAGAHGQITLTYATGQGGAAGGSGIAGSTGTYGGGGGSSAGPGVAGNAGSGATGGAAVTGGGPGGNGATIAVTVVQFASAQTGNGSSVTATFPKALQAGNGVMLAAFASTGTGSPSVNVTLSDGTTLSQNQTESLNGLSPNSAYVYSVWNVAGGQTSVTFHMSVSGQNIAVQAWEVSGMGTSPNTDLTVGNASASGSPNSSYTVSGTTNNAPELWFGMVADQATNGSTIYAPSGSWTSTTTGNSNHKIMSAYQWSTAAGTAKLSGKLSGSANWGAIIVTFTPSAATNGNAPIIPPGGAGGGGLGSSGNGGAGSDGQVALTWTTPSGSGYGTPALPAPYATYSAATTLGTTAGAIVNVNGATGPAGVLNFLQNAPMLRIATTSGQSITTATLTNVSFSGSTADVDNYSGWSAGTYTVARDGLYFFHGLVAFASASSGTRQAGVTVNSTTYWGPPSPPSTSTGTHVAKTQILSLRAGDTVKLACRQDSGGTVNLSATSQTRMCLAWLCLPGVPVQPWMPPDATFRWTSGTKGADLPALMQTHFGNDLSFLCQPPLLMAYQTIAQTGLAVGSFSSLVLDTVAGIVHADAGDTYTGWTPGASNKYTAQVAGWYLCVAEAFCASDATSGATVTAAFAVSSSGGVTPSVTPDYGQQLVTTSTASVGGGAACVDLVYLGVGESVTPQVRARSYAAPYSTLVGTSNSGTYASHAEVVFISE